MGMGAQFGTMRSITCGEDRPLALALSAPLASDRKVAGKVTCTDPVGGMGVQGVKSIVMTVCVETTKELKVTTGPATKLKLHGSGVGEMEGKEVG
jgi:hypothetical protein